MSRILAIDYGKKRTGLAWTDPMRIIATPLETVPTDKLRPRIQQLIETEPIDTILLGYPTRLDGTDTHATADVRELETWFKATFPALTLKRWDERFTSKQAMQTLIDAGVKKKKRRDKGLIDRTAAVIMLQEYLQWGS